MASTLVAQERLAVAAEAGGEVQALESCASA
jgi:hypothetical protein